MAYFPHILYGGDYNPEQWDEAIWKEDMCLFPKAYINTVTINVFSWAQLQPDEDHYDFSTLDKIMDMLVAHHYSIIFATSTASLPLWMSTRYPDVNRVDYEGHRHRAGLRHNACPHSPTFQKYASRLVEALVKRYGHIENIVCWHISNEYGGMCYCENCQKAFRIYLKDKYHTLEALNKAWNTSFWGHTISSFEDIVAPNIFGDGMNENKTAMPAISIDYQRFYTLSLVHNFQMEKAIIRRYDSTTPVTTNLMGAYEELDYYQFAHPYNALKRPGEMRLMSYQAMAHGADTIGFFQLRQSRGGCEKFYGAVISHSGRSDTRVFKEVSQLGEELSSIDEIIDARTPARVGLFFDWNSDWGLTYSSGPSVDLHYVEQVHHYYEELYRRNIDVDMVSFDSSLEDYDLLIAPCLYMVDQQQAQRISSFVKKGGVFVTTMMSGLADQNDNIYLGGYPGVFRELVGTWVEEFDALPPHHNVSLSFTNGKKAKGSLLCDIMHPQDAEILATYDQGSFYEGTPVITHRYFGKGQTYYVGTMLDEEGMHVLFDHVLKDLDLSFGFLPEGIEWKRRKKGHDLYHFLMNHTDHEIGFSLKIRGLDLITHQDIREVTSLKPFDIKIIKERVIE